MEFHPRTNHLPGWNKLQLCGFKVRLADVVIVKSISLDKADHPSYLIQVTGMIHAMVRLWSGVELISINRFLARVEWYYVLFMFNWGLLKNRFCLIQSMPLANQKAIILHFIWSTCLIHLDMLSMNMNKFSWCIFIYKFANDLGKTSHLPDLAESARMSYQQSRIGLQLWFNIATTVSFESSCSLNAFYMLAHIGFPK